MLSKSVDSQQSLAQWHKTILLQTRMMLRFSVDCHETFIKLSFIIVHYGYIKGLLHYRIALHGHTTFLIS